MTKPKGDKPIAISGYRDRTAAPGAVTKARWKPIGRGVETI